MPVEQPQPPDEVAEVVRSTLDRFESQPEESRRLQSLGDTRPGNLSMDSPHEVFTLGLDQLQFASDLASARSTGWRYLLHEGDRLVASAEAVVTPEGRTAFSQFNSGPFVASTAEALERGQSVAGARTETLVTRLLHVPALYAMALWLYHPGGGDDVVLPLRPTPPTVDPDREYSPQDYLAALREAAAAVSSVGPEDTTGG
jgi:hypothetical protein